MKIFIKLTLSTLALFVCWTHAASAGTTVRFVQPEKFTDMPLMQHDKDAVLKTLEDHLTRLGAQLPKGQDLIVEVLDVDLAGRIEPFYRNSRDVRVLRGNADWPTIDLRFTVQANGVPVKSGQAHLTDMNYMGRRVSHYGDNDALRYEKQMLDDWWTRTLSDRAAHTH